MVKNDKVDLGYYAVGWCKTGSQGVIDTTLLGCEETINNIRIHIENGVLEEKAVPSVDEKGTMSFEAY